MYENNLEKSERKYMKAAASELFEDQLLQSILTIVQDGVCFISKELDVMYVNPAMMFWYGLDKNPIGEKCYRVFHKRNKPCENCSCLRSIESGRPEVDEQKYEVEKENKGWQRVFAMPVQDINNDTMMLIEYVRDITNERQLNLSVELLENQIEVLSDIIERKEKEREEKYHLFVGNMNRSMDVVLNYLNKILDKNSYDLIRNHLKTINSDIDKRATAHSSLSDQERVIARYIAQGYMSKEIADIMHISKKTIDYHRTNIRKKLNLKADENLKIRIQEYFTKEEDPS